MYAAIIAEETPDELAKPHGMHILKAGFGDQRIMWDRNNRAEVDAAEETFKRLTRAGYDAFETDKDGNKKGKMTAFKPDAERMILSPRIVGG